MSQVSGKEEKIVDMFDKLDKFSASSNIFFFGDDVFCKINSTLNLELYESLCFHVQWLVLFLACDFSRHKICTPFFFRSIVVKLYFWIGNFQENFLLSNRTILLAKWCRSNVQFKCMTRNVHLFFFGFLLSCKSSKKIPSERERESQATVFNFR